MHTDSVDKRKVRGSCASHPTYVFCADWVKTRMYLDEKQAASKVRQPSLEKYRHRPNKLHRNHITDYRQKALHRGALTRRALKLQIASSPTHRDCGQGQSETAATPLVLGCKKRLVDTRLYRLIHPRSRVLNSQKHQSDVRRSATDSNDATVGRGTDHIFSYKTWSVPKH